MGVEVDGDFGDLLEDLESFVFEVDSAEADGLELAQDAGDFAGFATQTPLAGEAGADPVGEEADAHVVDDALGLAMEDWADLWESGSVCIFFQEIGVRVHFLSFFLKLIHGKLIADGI